MNPLLAYTIGLIGGDGTLTDNIKKGEYVIAVTDECLQFHLQVTQPILSKLFNKKPKISKIKTKKGNISFRTRICSKSIVRFYESIGRQYIRGWMDAESWVTTKKVIRKTKTYVYPKIGFQVSNKTIRDDLVFLLNKLGITPSVWKSKNMFVLQIIGFKKVMKYMNSIGFYHPEKIEKVRNLLGLGPNAAYNGWDNVLQRRKAKPIT